MTAPLVARTRRVDRDLDLLELGGRGRGAARALAGSVWPAGGGAPRDGAAAVDAALRRHRGRRRGRAFPAPVPVAFGALPFRPDPTAPLVIPELVWGRADDGTRWVTTDRPADAPAVDPATLCTPVPPPPAAPGERRGRGPCAAPEWWCELVAEATKAMRDAGPGRAAQGGARSRGAWWRPTCPSTGPLLLRRLRAAYPGLLPLPRRRVPGRQPRAARRPRTATWCGPSRWPARRPAAATRPPTPALAAGAAGVGHLPARAPDHHRHGVRHAPALVLLPRLRARAVRRGRRQRPAPRHAGGGAPVAARAVGRSSWWRPSTPPPRSTAGPATGRPAWIAEHEGFDRGRYAGTVGWVDARGNGTFAVGIRCADVDGTTARVVAGNGIVADSDPDTELAETQVKLQALLSALTRV